MALEIGNSSSSSSKFMGDFILYRIRDDEGLVCLFPANLFEIVSNKMFSRWAFHRIAHDYYSILPQTWARDSFWEDYYNDDKQAIDDFNKEEAMLLEEVKC